MRSTRDSLRPASAPPPLKIAGLSAICALQSDKSSPKLGKLPKGNTQNGIPDVMGGVAQVTDIVAPALDSEFLVPSDWHGVGNPTLHEDGGLALAQTRYRQRRLRDRLFGEELFRDPAWDILLDLFIADSQGVKISVTSASWAAGVPAPTGLRWIAKLERRNLVRRCREAGDGRLVCVQITDSAREKMAELLRRFDLD